MTLLAAPRRPCKRDAEKQDVPWIRPLDAADGLGQVRVLDDRQQQDDGAQTDKPILPRVDGKESDEQQQ